jgi:hypothetical protein
VLRTKADNRERFSGRKKEGYMNVASLPKWVLATCLVLIVLFVGYSAITGVHFDWTPSVGFSQGLLRLKGTKLKTVGPFTVGASNGWQTNANGNLALSAINTQVDQGNGICFLTFLQGPLKPGAKVGFDFVSGKYRFVLWVAQGDTEAQAQTTASAQCIQFDDEPNTK